MIQFITVLNQDMNRSYWRAVQWDDTLDSISGNPYYTAGVQMSLPRHPRDHPIQETMLTEVRSNVRGSGTIIQLHKDTAVALLVASHRQEKNHNNHSSL